MQSLILAVRDGVAIGPLERVWPVNRQPVGTSRQELNHVASEKHQWSDACGEANDLIYKWGRT